MAGVIKHLNIFPIEFSTTKLNNLKSLKKQTKSAGFDKSNFKDKPVIVNERKFNKKKTSYGGIFRLFFWSSLHMI